MAAKVLAENGFKVALVERDRFPRDKPCGGALRGPIIHDFPHVKSVLKSMPTVRVQRLVVHPESLKDTLDFFPHETMFYSVQRFDFDKTAPVEGHHMMRISLNRTMARKVFADGFHARSAHPAHPGIGQVSNLFGISVEGTITNYAADRVGNIEYRCKAQIDPVVKQFCGHYPGEGFGAL